MTGNLEVANWLQHGRPPGACISNPYLADARPFRNFLKTSNCGDEGLATRTRAAGCSLVENFAGIRTELHERDEFWWTARISDFAKRGEGRQALKTYRNMQEARVKPSSYTFVAALKACRCLQDLDIAKQIHAEVVASGFAMDMFIGNMLVDVYAKCRSLADARCVFETMKNRRSVVSWNAMIMAYAQLGEGLHALHLYDEMQQQGVQKDDRTFVAALKACSCLATVEEGTSADKKRTKALCLQHARSIHSDVVKCGSESAVFVSNILVDVYARCGSLVDARAIFEKMHHRNVVSWTAMIMGYVHMEQCEVALELYRRMRMEGVAPNDRTFVAVLKAYGSLAAPEGQLFSTSDGNCVRNWCLDQVRAVHFDVVNSGFLSATCVGNVLVDVYVKCGSLLNSRHVFEELPKRDVVSWNTMILGYAQMEEGEEALQLFTRMKQDGVVPDDRTFVAALKACSSVVSLDRVKQGGSEGLRSWCLDMVRGIHLDVIRSGSESAVFVGNMLVDVYLKSGNLLDALRVFEKMPCRDVVSWNAMISGHALLEQGEEALRLYAQMQQEGVAPDDRTFVATLKACSSLIAGEDAQEINKNGAKKRCLEKVRAIHADAERSLSQPALFLGNMLVDMYAKCGSLVEARSIFETMPSRNEISWTAMILGYAQMDRSEEALQLYAQMRRELAVPDARVFVAALKACSSMAQSQEMIDADRNQLKRRCLEHVTAIHGDLLRSGCQSDLFVGNILVDVYGKCGSLEDARQVFEHMPQHDVVSWNAIILGYAQVDNGREALRLYAQMQQEDVKPNHRTFVGALMACGTLAALEKGREVHAQLSKSGLEVTDSYVASSLIDMYGKCGSMVDAHQVFDALVKRDAVIWNALISGYARQGESDEVFRLVEQMKNESIQPEAITFLSILTVCSHSGLLDKGQSYFESMLMDSGITPTIEHYTCLVDLLGRGGLLHRALEVLKTMPFPADSVIWETFLGACRKWGAVDLGIEAFELAVRAGTAEAAAHMVMSNIYWDVEMWDKAKEVQEGRMTRRAWKQPGQSWWTDTNGDLWPFAVGDSEYFASHQIYVKLLDLFTKLKELGDVSVLEHLRT